MRPHRTFILSLTAMLCLSATARAGVPDLLSDLASDDLKARDQAQQALFRDASHAGRPGADAERAAYSEAICAALADSPPLPAALALVRQLQQIGGEEAVGTLSGLLAASDIHLRNAALMGLALNPSPAAAESLLAGLRSSPDARTRIGILSALGRRGDPSAVPALKRHLARPQFAEAAAAALAWIPHPAAAGALFAARRDAPTPALTRSLLDLAATCRRADNTVLATRIYRRLLDDSEPETVRAAALIGYLTLPGAALKVATEYLAQPSETLQAAVIEAASQIPSVELRQQIAARLPEASVNLQLRILGLLEQTATPGTEDSVLPLLGSADRDLDEAATATLAAVGTEHSIPALLEAGAVDALSLLRPPATDLIIDQYAAEGEPAARTVAIQVLANRQGQDATPRLTGYAHEENDAVATAALRALKDVAPPEAMAELTTLMVESPTSDRANGALDAIVAVLRRAPDATAAVAVLAGRLPGADPTTEGRIYKALAEAGTDAALAPVAATARSGDPERLPAAIRALGAWPEPNAIPTLLALAQDKDLELKDHALAMRGLARLLGTARRVDLAACSEGLQAARRPEERKLIVGVIGQSGDAAALELVEPYLKDPELKAEAALAAEAIRKRMDRAASR